MELLYIAGGKAAKVSPEDYAELSTYRWSMNTGGYAQRTIGLTKICLHQHLMRAPAGMEIDHIDGDKLNNTRGNLRICTKSQNQRNAKSKSRKSKFKGISTNGTGWSARIHWNYNSVHLGTFSTEEAAARAYDRAAHAEDPEFARLNFSDGIWSEEKLGEFKLTLPPPESGLRGVTRNGVNWKSRLKLNGKSIHLGTYKTPQEAHEKFIQAETLYRHQAGL